MDFPQVRTMIDPEYRKTLGRRIKELRKKSKLTQKELALALEISANQLNKYECGLTCPAAELFFKLAEILGVTLNILMTGRQLDLPVKNSLIFERSQCIELINSKTNARSDFKR